MVFTTVIGLIIFQIINKGRYNDAFVFCSRDIIIHKLFYDIYNDLFNIVSFYPDGVPFFSLQGILSFAKLFLLSFALGLSLLFIFRYKDKNDIDVFICINCCVLVMICLAQYLFGAYASERTLYNAILGILLLASVSFNKSFSQVRGKDLATLSIIVLVSLFSCKQVIGYIRGNEILKQKVEIADLLKNSGLSFGYSTSFDYARQLSVVSKEENETILALYSKEDNLFVIESKHTFPYERSKPKGISKTYIIIPNDEMYYNVKDNNKFEKLVNLSVDSIESDLYTILVYDMSDFDKVFEFE